MAGLGPTAPDADVYVRGIHSTSHTSERSTSGHRATTRLRVLARSSSGVRASFFSIIDSLWSDE